MKKEVLDSFVRRYNLGGSIEKVTWVSDGTGLSLAGMSDDNNVICFITTTSIKLPAGEYPIYGTSQLKSMLAVLGDDINVEVNKVGDQPVSFIMDDTPTGKAVIRFALSEPSIVGKSPSKPQFGDSTLTMTFDSDFMTQFVRSKAAFSDAKIFTVHSKGESSYFILGDVSNSITSQVKLDVTDLVRKGAIKHSRTFNADYLREIFQANKDAVAAQLSVTEMNESASVMQLRFDYADMTNVSYYLPQVRNDG